MADCRWTKGFDCRATHFRVVIPKSLVMVGRLDCAVTNRDGTGRSRWLTAARRWPGGGAGGSYGQAQERRVRAPHTPYTDRATGLLMPIARNRSRFIEIAISSRRSRPDIPRPRNTPFRLNRRVPGRKSVIAAGANRVVTLGGRRHPVVSPSRCGRSRRLRHLFGAPGSQHLKQIRCGSGSTLTAPRNVRTKSEPPRKPLYDSQGAFTGGLP